jgi:hypothetical protein
VNLDTAAAMCVGAGSALDRRGLRHFGHSELLSHWQTCGLFAYVAFAGASILWSFRPEISLTRYVLKIMVHSSIVLPNSKTSIGFAELCPDYQEINAHFPSDPLIVHTTCYAVLSEVPYFIMNRL